MKKRRTVLIGLAFLVAVIGLVIYTTMGQNAFRVEICIEFQGRSACRIAGAATMMQARRAATENACAQIASGVTDTVACENTAPKSVTWLSQKVTEGK